MKAIRIHSYGGPEVLAQVEMQRPAPGANEVLIKVHAASVNPFDWKARAGYAKEFFPLTFASHTFVIPPFYYQNLVGALAPQKQPDGSLGWAIPLDSSARCVHMGDIR